MESTEWRIQYLTLENGKSPFRVWLFGLDRSTRLMIERRLARVRLGNFGDYKSVGSGVIELRFAIGPGYRAYIGIPTLNTVVFIYGGTKRTQEKDIIKAKWPWRTWQNEAEGF